VSTPIALPQPVALTRGQRCAARAAVATAWLLLAATRRRPALLHRLLAALNRHAQRPASLTEARAAHRAVTGVSLRCASDHGCRPRSLAVMVWCLATRRRVTLLIGTATGPLAVHAWIEAHGVPVAEPTDPHLLYQPIITI
jgi:hypothetical protein